jgi:hypothetical protein
MIFPQIGKAADPLFPGYSKLKASFARKAGFGG